MDKSLADQLKLGGPGHDGYAYRADVYCVPCGRKIIDACVAEGLPFDTLDSALARDTETVPQPIFFGESDSEEHCGQCGEYLYGTN